MIVVSEIGDSHRYAHPRQLMAYLGLVPSESSSGGSRCQGSITEAGNGHLRWIFNECVPSTTACHPRSARNSARGSRPCPKSTGNA